MLDQTNPEPITFTSLMAVSYAVPSTVPEFPLELRYAEGFYASLVSENVDLINYGDGRSSLALAGGKKPQISYMKRDATGFSLRHAQRGAGGKGWVTQVASRRKVHPGKENAIATDSTGRVSVSHWRDDSVPSPGPTGPPFTGTRELLVSTRGAAGNWHEHLRPLDWDIGADHSTFPILDSSLAYDSSDEGHLAYIRTFRGVSAHTSGLFYTVESQAKVWNQPIQMLAQPGPDSQLLSVPHAQIALDSNDKYHIVYTTWERSANPSVTPTKCFLRYVTNSTDAPEVKLIAPLSEDYKTRQGVGVLNICAVPPTFRPAIAIGRDDTVHVAYHDNGTPENFCEDSGLWYAKRKRGENWKLRLVDPLGAARDFSIAVGNVGDVTIAYAEPFNDSYRLKFAFSVSGSSWSFSYPPENPPRALAKLGDIAVFSSRGRSNFKL